MEDGCIKKFLLFWKIFFTRFYEVFTAEPVVILGMAGKSMYDAVSEGALVVKLCNDLQNATLPNATEIDCNDYSTVQDLVEINWWNIYTRLANYIPAIVFSSLLSAWSDKVGRKFIILIALLGIMINQAAAIAVLTIDSAPTWTLISTFTPIQKY